MRIRSIALETVSPLADAPEPSSVALLAGGLATVGLGRRCRWGRRLTQAPR